MVNILKLIVKILITIIIFVKLDKLLEKYLTHYKINVIMNLIMNSNSFQNQLYQFKINVIKLNFYLNLLKLFLKYNRKYKY